MIILATQKKIMSWPVIKVLEGRKCFRSSVSLGHPIVANGHRADENQVSSTSPSWLSGKDDSKLYFSRASSWVFATYIFPLES